MKSNNPEKEDQATPPLKQINSILETVHVPSDNLFNNMMLIMFPGSTPLDKFGLPILEVLEGNVEETGSDRSSDPNG